MTDYILNKLKCLYFQRFFNSHEMFSIEPLFYFPLTSYFAYPAAPQEGLPMPSPSPNGQKKGPKDASKIYQRRLEDHSKMNERCLEDVLVLPAISCYNTLAKWYKILDVQDWVVWRCFSGSFSP
ncbi:MAG: hypothetical protein J5602_07205 [Clostridia bacterium]|nr:hypothetical protein [Clostridia bacterium]